MVEETLPSAGSGSGAPPLAAETGALDCILSSWLDGNHGLVAQRGLPSASDLSSVHTLALPLPASLPAAAASAPPLPPGLTLGDVIGQVLSSDRAVRASLEGPGVEGLEAAFAEAAVSGADSGALTSAVAAWAAQSSAATAAFVTRVTGEVAAVAQARTEQERAAAAPWCAPYHPAKDLQPWAPSAADAELQRVRRLDFATAALEGLIEDLTEAQGSFSRAEGKLRLGSGRCAAALAASKSCMEALEAAQAAGGLPSLLDMGRVEAALLEGHALMPRLHNLAGKDSDDACFGAGEGEEEEPEEDAEVATSASLPECLKRALTVLGAPPASGPAADARAPLPPALLATLQPTVAALKGLLAAGATGGRDRDLATAVGCWDAVARAYAESEDRELRARAASYYSDARLRRIQEAQLGVGATPLHGFLTPNGREREMIRCGSAGAVPNVIPFGEMQSLVREMFVACAGRRRLRRVVRALRLPSFPLPLPPCPLAPQNAGVFIGYRYCARRRGGPALRS